MSDLKHMVPIKKHTISGTYEIDSVNARDLWKALGVGKDFSNWIKGRIQKYDFKEGEDYAVLKTKKPLVNETKEFSPNLEKIPNVGFPILKTSQSPKNICSPNLANKEEHQFWKHSSKNKDVNYIVTLDMAKELAMLQNNDLGKQARRYFIECEKQLKQNSVDSLKGLFEYMDVNNNTGMQFLRGVSHSSIGVDCKNILIEIPYKNKSARVYFKDLKLYDELKILKKKGMSIERFQEYQRKNEELKDKTFELNNQVLELLELNKRLESKEVDNGDVEKQTHLKIEQLEKTNTYLLELLDIYKKEIK